MRPLRHAPLPLVRALGVLLVAFGEGLARLGRALSRRPRPARDPWLTDETDPIYHEIDRGSWSRP